MLSIRKFCTIYTWSGWSLCAAYVKIWWYSAGWKIKIWHKLIGHVAEIPVFQTECWDRTTWYNVDFKQHQYFTEKRNLIQNWENIEERQLRTSLAACLKFTMTVKTGASASIFCTCLHDRRFQFWDLFGCVVAGPISRCWTASMFSKNSQSNNWRINNGNYLN